MPFVKNAWYPAASAEEVGRGLFHRTVLGRSVLLYRKEDGTPVALENLCPHRFAPLDRGRLVGDAVECGYHGLVFASDGACVLNPHGDGRIPPAAKVEAFALVERHRLLWIWMGGRAADPALIPNCGFIDNTASSVSTMDHMRIDAHYQLVMDNILDLSHTDYLHKGSFGGNAGNKATLEIVQDGASIVVKRSFSEGNLSPVLSSFSNYRGPVDRWQDMRWDPTTVLTLSTGATPAGRPRSEGFTYLPWQIVTPETETSTHLFFGKARNFNLSDPEMDARTRRDMRNPIFGEDKPMIEAQQAIMGEREFWSMRPVLFSVDAGAVQVRRALDRMLAAESQ